jgi:hypothetical protein
MDASGRAPGKDQGSMGNELMGVAPQNLARDAAGVSLTQPERNFLDALLSLASASLASPTSPGESDETDAPDDMPVEDPFKVVVPTDYIPKARAKKPYMKKERPVPGIAELVRLGRKVHLSEDDVGYVLRWVVEKDEEALTFDKNGKRMLRNPAVRKFINAAAAAGLCSGTTASKEEIADFYTRRMRCEVLPDAIRNDAADKLAKLMGYNPKSEGGQGSVTVQINCVDPYAVPPKAEVVDA